MQGGWLSGNSTPWMLQNLGRAAECETSSIKRAESALIHTLTTKDFLQNCGRCGGLLEGPNERFIASCSSMFHQQLSLIYM